MPMLTNRKLVEKSERRRGYDPGVVSPAAADRS
jgi:hypothetical protein